MYNESRTVINHWLVVILVYFLISNINCSQYEVGSCIIQMNEPCDGNIIKFLLYSSDNPTKNPIRIDPRDPRIPNTYSLKKNTKIIIHGYGGRIEESTSQLVTAYKTVPGLNIIWVDWQILANLPCYPTAVANTIQVSQCTAVLLSSLLTQGLHASQIHIIGFSLGANVASYASNIIQNLMAIRIKRITGLDPALPLFATLSISSDWKLDKNDADFVDIIHTNAGIYGKVESTGHVDFYLNGGTLQPACDNNETARVCSHLMAPIYFAESITSKRGFWGYPCTSYFSYLLGWCSERYVRHRRALMGEHCNHEITGVYFVVTDKSPPYALG